MVVSCLREEELMKRDIHRTTTTRGSYYIGSVEENENKNVNMAVDVPPEVGYAQELAEAWDDIDGQELDPEVVRKARALEMAWFRKMNVYDKKPIENASKRRKVHPST